MPGTLVIPTSGTLSGLSMVEDANVAIAALATLNAGGSAPTEGETGLASDAGILWHDLVTNTIKMRNQADGGWITLLSIDEANDVAFASVRQALTGLTLSNDAVAPNTTLDIAAGGAVDITNTLPIILRSAMTKTTAAWAAGNGAGALDSGAVAASTWYHVFAISQGVGSADILFSANPTTPAVPAGWYRSGWLGAFQTDGSGHIKAFTQIGDRFLLAIPLVPLSGGLGSATNITDLGVPHGLVVKAIFNASLYNNAGQSALLLFYTPGTLASPAVSGTNFNLGVGAVAGGVTSFEGEMFELHTNASGQVAYSANASFTGNANLTLTTLGFEYPRGLT